MLDNFDMIPDALQREHELAKLESAAALAPNDAAWVTLTTEFLRLPSSCVMAVQEAVRQGRWRKAQNPNAYIRRVAKREAAKLGFADPKPDPRDVSINHRNGRGGTPISDADFLDYVASQLGVQKRDGVWHAVREAAGDTSGSILEDEVLDGVGDDLKVSDWHDSIEARGDGFYLRRVHNEKLCWQKIAAKAGLDAWETRVLEYRRAGISRERALAEQPSTERRNKLQAAWRRFDRNCIPKLRSLLKTSRS